jgi:uncharacterized protein (TIRG00374 family)
MKIKLNINRVTIAVVVLFVIAGALIVILDWKEMRQVIGQASWPLLLPALAFTAGSYSCLSGSVAVVFRTFGARVPVKDLLQIGFVSNVITFLMNVGGVTGVSLQFLLMKKRGLAAEDILAPSLFQLYFDSLMLLALLPIGLINILTSHTLSRSGSLGVGVAAGILTLLLVLASVIVFAASFRKFVFRLLKRLIRFVIRRDYQAQMDNFDNAMTHGVAIISHRPAVLAALLALAIGDWGSTVTALWFCFDALGNPIGVGTLLTGFSLGITAGFVSLVPGGLGVQEGSMAGLYALLGVPLRTAVLAAILFRIVYYFVPFLVSLGFYRRLLRESPQAEKSPPEVPLKIV